MRWIAIDSHDDRDSHHCVMPLIRKLGIGRMNGFWRIDSAADPLFLSSLRQGKQVRCWSLILYGDNFGLNIWLIVENNAQFSRIALISKSGIVGKFKRFVVGGFLLRKYDIGRAH